MLLRDIMSNNMEKRENFDVGNGEYVYIGSLSRFVPAVLKTIKEYRFTLCLSFHSSRKFSGKRVIELVAGSMRIVQAQA